MNRTFIPELPRGWASSPLKHACRLNPEVLPESTPEETEIEYVDIAALEGGGADFSPKSMTFGVAPSRARRVLRSGDTILSTVRTYLRAVATFDSAGANLIASTGFAVIRPDGRVHPRFAYWAVLSYPFVESVVANSEGVSYPAINPSVLGTLKIVCPPLADQTRIVAFLDEQTARIDALIAEKEGLLLATRELFEAKLGTAVVEGVAGRGTLTCRAEKGYDAVRADWRLVPLKYIASASGGITPSKDNPDYWGGDVPWVFPKDMKRFELGDSADHVTQLALEKTSLRLHPPFSVLVVVRGMILAHTFPVAINTVPVTINQDMKALRATDRVSVKYLAWMLRGLQPLMLSLTEESAHGTKALRTDQWSNQHVPLPSPEEQFELVSLFERWDEETGVLCAHLQEHIARLREYRSSLISAAVTGQLDIDTFQRDAEMEAA